MRRFRKIMAVLLAVVTITLIIPVATVSVGATQSRSYNFNTSYTLTGNGADDIVAIAQAQSNRSQGSLGYTEAWCADFTSDCARLADQEAAVPFNGGVGYLYDAIVNAGGWAVSSPQKGDIAFFDWAHVGIMVDSVNCISGNMWDNSGSYVRTYSYTAINQGSTIRFLRPNYRSIIPPDPYVDIGDNFYAFIINTSMWKHLTVEPDINVTLRSEKFGKSPDQVFKFEKRSDGSYKIISTANEYCLDVSNASSDSGANVGLYGSNDSNAQRWYIYGQSGNYTLRAKCTDCVLDVADGSSAEGTNIRMWTSNNSDAQKFQIYKIETRPFAADIGDNFTAPILNTKSWITLENNNGNLILNKEVGKSHQLWKFQRNLDGSYTIYSCLDGKCIDLYNFLHADGTNIGVHTPNGTNAQRWYYYYNGEFKSKESGKMFDVAGGSLTSGANIQAYTWNGSDYQRFSVYKGDDSKLKSPTLKVEAGTSITDTVFTWNNVYGETGYNLKIWKDKIWEGDAYKIVNNAESETKIVLPAGTYQAYVDAYNYFDIKMSNTVTFSVAPITVLDDSMVTIKDVVTTSDATSVNPSVTVKVDNKTLTKNTDYTVAVTSDIANGTGTVTITGKGNYSGTVTKSFKISINDTTVVNDWLQNHYYTEKGDIITFYMKLSPPFSVNHLSGTIYYNGEVLEPIITQYSRYHAPKFDYADFQRTGAEQIRFDLYVNNPVTLNNDIVVRMQFHVIKKGGESWLGNDFDDVQFTWDNLIQYGMEPHILTNQKLFVLGDTNGDGTVNICDVTALQRHLADLTTLTDSELAAADTNGDGKVDINDATYLQMYLAEYNVTLGNQS